MGEQSTLNRALVVDDDASVCELVHSVLTPMGLDVLALTDSMEALSLLRDEKFIVALLDLNMPPPDGLELARRARRSGFNMMTPIILISDDQSATAVSRGFDAGASFFLYKPIDKARLLKLIRAARGAIEQERRRFRRVPLRTKVQLSFEQQEWTGETLNVSLNGILVECSGVIPIGSNIQVSLQLAPDTKPIVATGYVVRIENDDKMGIELRQMPMTENARLRDFLLPLILREDSNTNFLDAEPKEGHHSTGYGSA